MSTVREVIDPGLSSGTEHPDDLVEAGRRVVPVVEAEGGDDEVRRSCSANGSAATSGRAWKRRLLVLVVLAGVEVARAIISGKVNAFDLHRGTGRGDEPGHSARPGSDVQNHRPGRKPDVGHVGDDPAVTRVWRDTPATRS